jgi:hypothetical protein
MEQILTLKESIKLIVHISDHLRNHIYNIFLYEIWYRMIIPYMEHILDTKFGHF